MWDSLLPKKLNNNDGFLLMDSIMGLVILAGSVLFFMVMYEQIMVTRANSELYLEVLLEFEENIYTVYPSEVIEVNGVMITFEEWGDHYYAHYTDLRGDEVEHVVGMR